MNMELCLDEESMIAFIKGLLCLGDNTRWVCFSPTHQLDIRFRGNCHNVQRAILDWLNTPERKWTNQKRR